MSDTVVVELAPGVTAAEFILALEVGGEEAALHARLAPGQDGCGDEFCTQRSHAVMADRAGLLDGIACRLRAKAVIR